MCWWTSPRRTSRASNAEPSRSRPSRAPPSSARPPTTGTERLEPERAARRRPAVRFDRSVLDVEVQREFVRVRAQADGVELVDPLVLDPGVDDVLSEHAALQQEAVVVLERVQDFLERARYLLDLDRLL